jgi:FkbM family methyltransferase
MKEAIVKQARHLNFACVLLSRFLKGKIAVRGLKFILNYHLLKFILTYQEIDFFSLEVVIDGGTNRGHFSEIVLRLNPTVRVYGFEPLATPEAGASDDSCYSSLERLSRRFPNFRYSPVALSETESTETFNVTLFDECSSLLKPRETSAENSFDVVRSFAVKCITLEAFLVENKLDKIDLLKLDLQGAELKALKGAGKMLSAVDFIFTELSFRRVYEQSAVISEVTEYLEEQNFVFVDIKNKIKTASGSITQIDGLFQRRVF